MRIYTCDAGVCTHIHTHKQNGTKEGNQEEENKYKIKKIDDTVFPGIVGVPSSP